MSQTDQASGVLPPPPPPPPSLTGRRSLGQDLARFFVYAEGGVLLLFVALPSLAHPAPLDVLAFVGAAVLIWGGFRMRGDAPRSADPAIPAPPVTAPRRIPWDWTDVAMFIPGAFIAAALLVSVAIPITDSLTGGAGSSARTAAESFVQQASFYGGGIFNVWLLAGLRRGATLQDLGFRRFEWWWLPAAVIVAALTWVVSGWLQIAAQHLFPSAQNTQCTSVKNDYSHAFVLAVFVVSVMAPLAEETIFRGFIYGWLAKVMPVGFAVVISGAFFGAVHGVLLLFIPLWAVGIVLALVYRGSNSLWPGVVVHSLFNLPGIVAILSSTSC